MSGWGEDRTGRLRSGNSAKRREGIMTDAANKPVTALVTGAGDRRGHLPGDGRRGLHRGPRRRRRGPRGQGGRRVAAARARGKRGPPRRDEGRRLGAGRRKVDGALGRLDVLVNNAGISPRGTVESTDEALWDRTLAINLKGAWLGIKAALPSLRKRAGDDRQHRLDPRHAADAGALPLRHQQGRALGPDPAGGRRVPDRGGDLQHGRPGLGRHARASG